MNKSNKISAEKHMELWQAMYPAVYGQKAIFKKISGDETVLRKLFSLLDSLHVFSEVLKIERKGEINGSIQFLLSKKNELNGFRDCITCGDRGDAELLNKYWAYEKVIDKVEYEIYKDYNDCGVAWDFKREVECVVDRELRYIDVEPIFIMLPDDEEFIERTYDEYHHWLEKEKEQRQVCA